MKNKIVIFLLILALFSSTLSISGCASRTPEIILSSSDKAIISYICENVDKWNNPIYDSGSNHDINRISFGRDASGSLLLATGWMTMTQTGSQYSSGILKTHVYDVDNDFETINNESSRNLFPSFTIDVKSMTSSEIYAAVEKAYISFRK